MSFRRWEVPSSWDWAAGNEIAHVIGGGTPRSDISNNFVEKGIPWITPADLTGYSDVTIARGGRDLSEQGLASSGATLMPAGTVLLSSRAPIGYCVIAANEITTNQGFKSFVPKPGIEPEFLRYYFLGSKEYLQSRASGTTFLELSGTRAGAVQIPVPPTPEQRRIVAKIDRLSARSNRARKELARVEALADKQRQAILSRYFGEMARYPRSAFGECIEVLTSGSRDWAQYYDKGTCVFVLAGNVRPLAFDPTPKRFVDPPRQGADARRSLVKQGDILLTIVGAGTGDICYVEQQLDNHYVCQSVALIRLKTPSLSAFYAYWFHSQHYGRADFEAAMYGAARPHLSFDQLKSFEVPIIPTDRASEIVRRIEHAFAAIDRLAAEAQSARALLERLDQAILTKAFRGELVPQDPDDEPASVLLDRIRAERAAAPKARRTQRRPAV